MNFCILIANIRANHIRPPNYTQRKVVWDFLSIIPLIKVKAKNVVNASIGEYFQRIDWSKENGEMAHNEFI